VEKGKLQKWSGIRKKSDTKHRKEISKRQLKRNTERRKTDIQFRLAGNLRSRLNEGLKKNFKTGSAVRDLGCSMGEFKVYVEKRWLAGMSWDNYGPNGWHLDHITPLASFDLQDPNQLRKACYYTNYQPLWAEDNRKKAAK